MSFILEALKKSEQERRRNQVPDLQTEHTLPPERRRGRRLWPVFILAALLLNAGLLLWMLYPESPSDPPVQQTASSAPVEPSVPSAPPAASALETSAPPSPRAEEVTVTSTPPSEANEPLAAPPSSVKPVVSSSQTPSKEAQKATIPKAQSGPPRMEDLPHSLRRELPEIAITLHFYTDAPAARMVRINGRNLRQTQRLDDNLILQEITPGGIVLDFKGQLFTVESY